MHHQVAVRVGDRFADMAEELEPFLQRRSVLRAVLGDGAPLDELHHHVGAAVGSDAAVVQARDARMLQPRQDLALGLKTLELGARFLLQQLDRGALLEVSLGPRGLVDVTHAAAPDPARDPPRPQAHADCDLFVAGLGRGARGFREETLGGLHCAQQAFHLPTNCRIADLAAAQARPPACLRKIQQLIEQGLSRLFLLFREHFGDLSSLGCREPMEPEDGRHRHARFPSVPRLHYLTGRRGVCSLGRVPCTGGAACERPFCRES